MLQLSHSRALRILAILVALSLAVGCASTKVGSVRDESRRLRLKKPVQVQVHDFGYHVDMEAEEDDHQELAPEAAEALSTELVSHIREMGLPAQRLAAGHPFPDSPAGNQTVLVIRGTFTELNDGSGAKRLWLGFGAGAAQVKSIVRLSWLDSKGETFLREFETISKTGKMPGLITPIGMGAVTGRIIVSAIVGTASTVAKRKDNAVGSSVRTADKIAEELEPFFRQKGWLRR